MQLYVAAKAIIVNRENKVLVVRESPEDLNNVKVGFWGLPGGRLEDNEPFYEGLKREVFEEVGLKIDVIGPAHVGEWWPKMRGIPSHIVGITMECRVSAEDDVRLSKEHDAYSWVDRSSYLNYPLMTPCDKALEEFFATTKREKRV